MHKLLFTLGLVAAGVAQAGDVELYGSIGYDIQSGKNGGAIGDDDIENVETATTAVNQSTGKFYLKGSEDLGGDLEAFFKMKVKMDDTENTSKAYAGLEGAFGKLTVGNQDGVYDDLIDDANDFNEADTWYSYQGPEADAEQAITYETPEIVGMTLFAQAVMDGDSGKNHLDAYDFALKYEGDNLEAVVAYQHYDDEETVYENVGAVVNYSNDYFRVGANYEHAASTGDYYNFTAEYYAGAHTLRLGLGFADVDGEDMQTGYGLGYQYNFSKRTYAWVEGAYMDYNKKDEDIDNGYLVSIGLRHDF